MISGTRLAAFPAALAMLCLAHGAMAIGLADLSNQDASQGLKGALDKGAQTAVSKLGVDGGFLGNPKVKIPLPPALEKASGALKLMGRSKDADELVDGMNHAAEQAVPQAKELLINAVNSMSIDDAKKILSGGDDSITQFFKSKTQGPLGVKFLPIVKQVTDRVGLAQKYNDLAAKGSKLGVVDKEDATVEQYVTRKALDGLYLMIGEEEKAIRQNPAQAGSAIVTKVFGALK
jgi:hypothetical protein